MAASGRHVIDQDQYPLQWYSRREGVIRGPFTAEDITRHILLGRICLDDELSTDKTKWSPANCFSEMLPPEVTSLTSWDDYQKLIEARMQVDERKSERRCQQCPNRDKCHPERRLGKDRRREDDDSGLVRQYLYNNTDRQLTLRPLLLTLLLATVLFAWLYPSQR
jgi:hypothetical protein